MSEHEPSTPPTRHRHPVPRAHATSVVIVNTGDGKGKSTAAFGTLLRGVARGWRCSVVQFVKSGSWRVGEEAVGRDLGVDWWAIGEGFTWDSDDLERDAAAARAAWQAARERLTSGAVDLLVLDEVTYPVNWGWLDGDDVAATIRDRAAGTNVICTGRDAPAPLLAVADTITEMRNVRHAYERGIQARRGIDF